MLIYVVLLAATAWASLLSRRNVMAKVLFFVPTMFIVGFKYEVGFDWSVYTWQFKNFSEMDFSYFLSNLFNYSNLYQHEPLFIALSYFSSQFLFKYEIFYFISYSFFVFSIVKLSNLLNSNYMASFFIIHLFLLFTLEFSTLRQMISLSFLNIGIFYYLSDRKNKGIFLMIMAPFFQGSTAIFVSVLFFSESTVRIKKIVVTILFLIAVSVKFIGLAKISSYFSGVLPGIYDTKLNYYTQIKIYNFNIFEIIFSSTLYLFIGYFLYKNFNNENYEIRFLSLFLFYLIVLAFVGFSINTIRNRMLYEIIPLASIILFSSKSKNSNFMKPAIISLGIFFFSISLVKPTSFMYVPYQNYIWYNIWEIESNGLKRQSMLNAYLRRN